MIRIYSKLIRNSDELFVDTMIRRGIVSFNSVFGELKLVCVTNEVLETRFE